MKVSFCRPMSCDLARQHHQLSAGARTPKFRVNAFFAPTSCLQPLGRGAPSLRKAETRVVSITNCAPPWRGRPSATTSSRRSSITFGAIKSRSLKNICRHSGACFPANSGNGTLQGKTSSPKHSCSAACCAVVAKRIEMATLAGARDRIQRQTKASEKQHTKEVCINVCGIVRRCGSQRRSRSWTALRPQESLPRSVQKKQDCFSTVAAFNTRSCLMLPTSPHCARLHLHCTMVWRACTSAESPPTGKFKTLHSVQGPRCFNHSTQRGSVAPSLQCRQSAQQRQGVVRGPSAMNRPSLPRMQAHWFSLGSAIPALPC